MALVLNLRPPTPNLSHSSELTRYSLSESTGVQNTNQSWTALHRELKCHGRFSCLFSGNRREEQARKAVEGALGGKKNEFEKWSKEIKRREEAGGGNGAGGGGWFGSGRWFGWWNDDNFWQEAQQTGLAILGIVIMYLVVAKGEVMLAVIFNPMLYALRGTRNGFTFITSRILGKTSPASFNKSEIKSNEAYNRVSAKESVTRKWGRE